jgi:hypothetical protein
MKSQEENHMDKVHYEKPTAVDLGPAAQIVGASCVPGDEVNEGLCAPVGNAAAGQCAIGSVADFICQPTGNTAVGDCATGVGGFD